MWWTLGKTAVVIAVPIVVGAIVDAVTSVTKKEKPKWTQYQFDYIKYEYRRYTHYNVVNQEDRIPLSRLIEFLNEAMSLDKTVEDYTEIFFGNIKRDRLPPGEPYFVYEDLI